MKNKKSFLVSALILCAAVMFCININAKLSVKPVDNPEQIIGVYTIIEPALPENGSQKKIKIITKNRFIMTHSLNNLIVLSIGGAYTFDGDTYVESIEYGTPNAANSLGTKGVFKVRLEGSKMYASGMFEGRVYNEIWERVE